MHETNAANSTIAQFYKCALQVNPYEYSEYRGKEREHSKEDYYRDLLEVCREEDIKVIGLADHGSVDAWDDVIEMFRDADIVVFPGFELTSSEKAHFVCLFDESYTKNKLNRVLGSLDALDPDKRVEPSKWSAVQLIDKVVEQGGFVYAAHVTNDNGILDRKLHHVWTHTRLRAAQIPGSVQALKGVADDFYRKVVLNKDPNYLRERPIAHINAADVVEPADLRESNASCLIKMSVPCFSSFKAAFLDPGSRVRLNSDVIDSYCSSIQAVEFTNGYLDGISLQFSDNLNTVIGGRGTGKSTLLEGVRFALNQRPIGPLADSSYEQITKANIGRERGTVRVTIRSSTLNGRTFTVVRKYGDNPVVIDENGETVPYEPQDLVPELEIYSQNEIHELVRDSTNRNKLINRFLKDQPEELEVGLEGLRDRLKENRASLITARAKETEQRDDVDKLPKLKDQIEQFVSLGIAENLKNVPHLEREKSLNSQIKIYIEAVETWLATIKGSIPPLPEVSDEELDSLPHGDVLLRQKEVLDDFGKKLVEVLVKIDPLVEDLPKELKPLQEELMQNIGADEKDLEKSFKKIPANRGKTGRAIGIEYQGLLQEEARIEPKVAALERFKQEIEDLYASRGQILYEMTELRASKTTALRNSVNRLNGKLDGKVRISLQVEGNRENLFEFLKSCNMTGVGPSRLKWILERDFSPQNLAQTIRSGEHAIREAKWGTTSVVEQELMRLGERELLLMDEIELLDVIELELNISLDESASPQFRRIDELSTGQQCTAVLHLLLLENNDPLILDQPEDNLDNAFIADRIVAELRSTKLTRQFIFATHNANIPVFGDAEWIGVLSLDDGKGRVDPDHQGSIDLPEIQRLAADILEGGKSAFNQRREKYGFD